MKKKILSLMLVATMALSMVACGSSASTSADGSSTSKDSATTDATASG